MTDMQRRLRDEKPPLRAPSGAGVAVPAAYWAALAEIPAADVAAAAGAVPEAGGAVVVDCLHESVRVDPVRRRIERRGDGRWTERRDPLGNLVLLAYLLGARPAGVTGERVGVNDLKSAHFFQGPHALRTDQLLTRFGRDRQAFEAAGRALGGVRVVQGADAAFRLLPLPKVPLYYHLWVGDEEFPADLKVLFDRSIETHLAADAIWGLVTWVSDALFGLP